MYDKYMDESTRVDHYSPVAAIVVSLLPVVRVTVRVGRRPNHHHFPYHWRLCRAR